MSEHATMKGMHDPDHTYRAIGEFIFEFSQLEYGLRHYVASTAGVPDEHFNAIMTHDFALLCNVALEVLSEGSSAEDKQKLRDIINECRKLNEIRVKVAHGLWVPFMAGGTVHHVSRSSLRLTTTEDQARLLEQHAKTAKHLSDMIHDWLWG